MINSEIGMVTDRTEGKTGALEQDIREKFRRSGYTLTSQRRAVLEALKEAQGHPSAEDIYLIVKKNNPRVALGTVYQALSVLEEIGVVESKHWSESPTRYDLNVEPHLDIRCAGCGEVSEIPGVELGELEMSIQDNTPYEVTRTTMVIEGLCPICKER
jgi:Fur family transcriptional regulator, ferric uptake regulator